MDENKVELLDCQSLIELRNTIDYCADSLLKVNAQINKYLDSNLEAFNKEKDRMQKELERAEEELRKAREVLDNAESELRSCEISQTREKDEDGNEYLTPSCKSEAAAVIRAQADYDAKEKIKKEWEEKVKKAESIVNDTMSKINDYRYVGGLCNPSGGDKTIEQLSVQHTDEAFEKLDKIIEFTERYLGREMKNPVQEGVSGVDDSMPMYSDSVAEKFRAGTGNVARLEHGDLSASRADAFRNAAERVRQMQESDSHYNNVANADTVVLCSGCGRPIPICICANIRERYRRI